MRGYVIRRLLLMVPTVFLVSLIIFFMVRLIPGSIVDIMEALEFEMSGVPVDRAAIERALGLDVPVFIQYGRWVGVVPGADGNISGLLQGDFGNSLWKGTPVIDEIAVRWPVTLELGLMGLIVSQLIGLPIGMYSAMRQDTRGDYIARSFGILLIAVPGFWVGTMAIVLPAMWWGYMPPIVFIPFTEDPIGNLQMLIVPAIILGMATSGLTMRMTRTMMLEVLRQDYIRTAWAKGLGERSVVLRHVLKNALIPVITYLGLRMSTLIGGSIIIEQIFCLPGLGRLIISATAERDYTIVSGVIVIVSAWVVVLNLGVDLTYGFLDPRVHYR